MSKVGKIEYAPDYKSKKQPESLKAGLDSLKRHSAKMKQSRQEEIDAAVLAEREACATVVEGLQSPDHDEGVNETLLWVAKNIRERQGSF